MRWAAFASLETSRLRLRKLRREDVAHYYTRLASSEAVTRYMLFQPHKSMEESSASVEKWLARYEAGTCYHWVIALKETDELIGMIEPLRFDEQENSCSFAYMLGEDFWGKGYGTEALTAVLDFLFSKMEMLRVEADHMAGNPASGAVMGKAGLVCCGRDEKKYEKNGIVHDAVRYVITKERWLTK